MTLEENRCVVTGLGVICAVGNNVEETWNNALKSVSGIYKTTSVDTKNCYADLAAEVKCDTLDDIDAPEEKDRVSKLCIKAANEALADAGLSNFNDDQRVSVIIGSCVGGVISIEHYHQGAKEAADIPKMPIASIASQVAETCGAGGIVTNVANACAAGTISIALACDLIRAGKADVVVAGGADSFAAATALRSAKAPASLSWNPMSMPRSVVRRRTAKCSVPASRAMRTTLPPRAKTRSA